MKPQNWAAVGAAVATVALTAGAFWLSYEHLHDVSAANGLTGSRAWAWPACLDLFIMIGELLMLRASLVQGGMDWWAVGLMVTGSGGSIALNVAGVGEGAPNLTYIVAAVPPVAALLAFGALMRQVHDHLATTPELLPEPMDDHFRTAAELTEVPSEPALSTPADTPVPVTLERVPETAALDDIQGSALALGPWTPVAELLAGTGRDLPTDPSGSVAEPAPEPAEPAPVVPEPDPEPQVGSGTVPDDLSGTDPIPPGVTAEHVDAAREWLATDPELTGTAIGTKLGKSDGYGRRVKRAALSAPPLTTDQKFRRRFGDEFTDDWFTTDQQKATTT